MRGFLAKWVPNWGKEDEYLEARHVLYAIRLPGNEVLQREIAPLLRRPVGRPPKRPVILYDDFWYCAGSWDRARRVVAKVEWHQGRAVPSGGLHRHEHDGWPRRCGAILHRDFPYWQSSDSKGSPNEMVASLPGPARPVNRRSIQ